MSTCKYKKNDYIANKHNQNELYFIVGVGDHAAIVRKENIEDLEAFTDEDLVEMEIHEINNKYSKVDIETYKLLFKDEEKKDASPESR